MNNNYYTNSSNTRCKNHIGEESIYNSNPNPYMLSDGINIPNNDVESFLKYIEEKMSIYEDNINLSYINLKTIITKLEEEFPQIDINSFSDFFLVCEEYFSLIQHSKQLLMRTEDINKDNEKLKIKLEKMKNKKFSLKSTNNNLSQENKFKDDQIKNLEENLSNMTKDYLELNNKLNLQNFNEKINNNENMNQAI